MRDVVPQRFFLWLLQSEIHHTHDQIHIVGIELRECDQKEESILRYDELGKGIRQMVDQQRIGRVEGDTYVAQRFVDRLEVSLAEGKLEQNEKVANMV